MARCSCNGQTCGCVIVAGDNITIEGAGTAASPMVISATGSGGGGSAFDPGDLKAVAYANTPAGWLECNGQAVSRTTFANLFTAIGTMYGAGNGSTTFNVPDLRDRAIIGASVTKPLASAGGFETTTLSTGNLPAHTHSMAHTHDMSHGHGNTSTESATHNHGIYSLRVDTRVQTSTTPSHPFGVNADSAGLTGSENQLHVHSIPNFAGNTGAPSAGSTGSAGTGNPFSNLPPYRAQRWLIKT